MAFILQITKKARENLDKLPAPYRTRVIDAFDDIVANPFLGKKLSGKKKGQYSIRVWPYRIIYSIEKKELVIIVIDVDHRGRVYR